MLVCTCTCVHECKVSCEEVTRQFSGVASSFLGDIGALISSKLQAIRVSLLSPLPTRWILDEAHASGLVWVLGIWLKVSCFHRRWFMWWAISLDFCLFIHFLILHGCSLISSVLNTENYQDQLEKQKTTWGGRQTSDYLSWPLQNLAGSMMMINTESADTAQLTDCLPPTMPWHKSVGSPRPFSPHLDFEANLDYMRSCLQTLFICNASRTLLKRDKRWSVWI